MISNRVLGLSHAFFDSNNEGFSNITAGILARAIGHNLSVALIDFSSKASKLSNFLENLFLSYNFSRFFERSRVETFTFKNDKISRAILPHVEFHNITETMMWNLIDEFDIVIFENVSFDKLPKSKIEKFVSSKFPNQEVFFIFSNKGEFKEVSLLFDNVEVVDVKENANLISNKNISCLFGEGKSLAFYSIGSIIRDFLMKEDAKYIAFEKEDRVFGEEKFFYALKLWSLSNFLYGKFDFVFTGDKRYIRGRYREDNTSEDFMEAENGLELLRTSLAKNSHVIADGIIDVLNEKLIDIRDVLDLIHKAGNEFVLTGKKNDAKILDLSYRIVEIQSLGEKDLSKVYVKGVDF